MTFQEALKELGIEEYKERIFNSNSHGELFHLNDYIIIAEVAKKTPMPWFKDWLDYIVKYAKNEWNRPESIFQHIPKMLTESLGYYLETVKKQGLYKGE